MRCLDESISDLVYSCQYKGCADEGERDEARTIILVEHQSVHDRFMPVRVYDYTLASGLWRKELASREDSKQTLLPACHALVFYHGEQTSYPYSMDLASCINDPKGRMEKFCKTAFNW